MVKIIENYSLHDLLGQGVYGKVYKGVHIKTKQEVAVKVIRADKFKEIPKLEEFIFNEINTLTTIEHNPHIVKYLDMLRSVNNFYFVYEYCNGGTLDKLLQGYRDSGTPMPLNKALLIFRDIVDAFKTLTKNNIMHRDLKPHNILLHNGVVKLADFGFCKSLKSPTDLAQTMLGSPIYMAPEVLRGQIYTMKADVWSLGVVLYQMVFGACPFQSNSIAKLIQTLQVQEVKFNKQLPPAVDGLLRKMLVKDSSKRMDWAELFEYKITQSGDLIENKNSLLCKAKSLKPNVSNPNTSFNSSINNGNNNSGSPVGSTLMNSASMSSTSSMAPSNSKISSLSTEHSTSSSGSYAARNQSSSNNTSAHKGSERNSGSHFLDPNSSQRRGDLRSKSPVPDSSQRRGTIGKTNLAGFSSYGDLDNSGIRPPMSNTSYPSKSPIRDRTSKYSEFVNQHRKTANASKLCVDALKLVQLKEGIILAYLISKANEKQLQNLCESVKKQLNQSSKYPKEEQILLMQFRATVETELNHLQDVGRHLRAQMQKFEPDVNSLPNKRNKILKYVLEYLSKNNFFLEQDPDNLILTVQLMDYFDELYVLRKDGYRKSTKQQLIRQVTNKINQLA